MSIPVHIPTNVKHHYLFIYGHSFGTRTVLRNHIYREQNNSICAQTSPSLISKLKFNNTDAEPVGNGRVPGTPAITCAGQLGRLPFAYCTQLHM